MIEVGIKNREELTVTEDMTAAKLMSGQLDVYATPSMIAFMEYTCSMAVGKYLDKTQGTVGTLVNVRHMNASPVGSRIVCECELIEVDRRKLVFSVQAHDDFGIIGEGIHERFIIDNSAFMEKIIEKKSKLRQ